MELRDNNPLSVLCCILLKIFKFLFLVKIFSGTAMRKSKVMCCKGDQAGLQKLSVCDFRKQQQQREVDTGFVNLD